MKNKLGIVLVALIVLLSLTVAASCAAEKVAPTATKVPTARGPAGKVIIGVSSLAGQHLDPYEMLAGIETIHLRFLYDPLLDRNLGGKLDTLWSVVQSWEIIDGGLGYRLHIRPGLKFHNAEALTAEDVKFSLDYGTRQEAKGTPAAYLRPQLDRVAVEDEYTAVVYLKTPNAPFAERLNGLFIVPKDNIEKNGSAYFASHPIGSGAYKLVDYRPDDYYTFEALEDYWRGAPYVKTVVLRIIPEDATRLAMLKTGEIDIMGGLLPALKAEVDAYPGIHVERVENASKMWAMFPDMNELLPDGTYRVRQESPLAKVKVRQALNYAVDRKTISETLYFGEASPMVTMGEPMAFGTDLTLKPYPYDPKKAKELLAEAGYAQGFRLNIYTVPHAAITGMFEMADILARYFGEIGVDSSVIRMEYGTKTADLKNRRLPGMCLEATVAQYDAYIPLFYYSKTGTWSMHSEADMDALIAQIERATTREEQERLTKQADRWTYERAHHLFLVYANQLYGVSDRIAEMPQIAGNGYINRPELIKLKE